MSGVHGSPRVIADVTVPGLGPGLEILGSGRAFTDNLASHRGAGRPSFYADPLAWLVNEAVAEALHDCDDRGERVRAAAEDVGSVLVSDVCTITSMRSLAKQLPSGRLSPLRFSGANPGMAGSLAPMSFGFTGPTLTLTMPPAAGIRSALTVLEQWLRGGAARYVVLSWSEQGSGSEHSVTSVVLRAIGPKEVSDGR